MPDGTVSPASRGMRSTSIYWSWRGRAIRPGRYRRPAAPESPGRDRPERLVPTADTPPARFGFAGTVILVALTRLQPLGAPV